MKELPCFCLAVLCMAILNPLTGYRIEARANTFVTWTVDDNGPANFSNIQEAINSPSVFAGDMILVRSGTYHENLVINKTLSLVGEDTQSTIVDGDVLGTVVSVEVDNVNMTGFTVRNSLSGDSGIRVQHSDYVIMSNNIIIDNSVGISLILSNYATISNNTLASNAYYGIQASSSNGNLITRNAISESQVGIFVFSSSREIISENAVLGNSDGIYCSLCSESTISGNDISFNLVSGIKFDLDSNSNTIFHNNFVGNGNHVQISTELTEHWDYAREGNYWDNYTGSDVNEDAIGDYVYVINSANEDNYPLTGMSLEFEVIAKEATFEVFTISNSTIMEAEFQIGTETGNRMLFFNATGPAETTGFCRITIPTQLMSYPYILYMDSLEISPKTIGAPNETAATIYFNYPNENQTIRIISSEALHLYATLLDNYSTLESDFDALNLTYVNLLNLYSSLLSNYTQLEQNLDAVNASQQQMLNLNASYSALLDNYAVLQKSLDDLNISYVVLLSSYSALQPVLETLNLTYASLSSSYSILQTTLDTLNTSYTVLWENYTQLQKDYNDLNQTYQQHVLNYSDQTQNVRSLTYIVIAIAAIFIVVAIYLSRKNHSKPRLNASLTGE